MTRMTAEQARAILSAFQWQPDSMHERHLKPRLHAARPAVRERILDKSRPLTLTGRAHVDALLCAAYEAGVYHPALEGGATKLDVLDLMRDVLAVAGIPVRPDAGMINVEEGRAPVEESYGAERAPTVWISDHRFERTEDGEAWQTYYGPTIAYRMEGETEMTLRGLDIALLKDFGIDFPNASRLYDTREDWHRGSIQR